MSEQHSRIKELSLAICTLFAHKRATNMDGCGACAAVLASTMVSAGYSKQQALEVFADVWDLIEDDWQSFVKRSPPRGEDYEFEVDEDVQAAIDADPKMAAFVRETGARIRQALHGISTGQFKDVDEALRSIGAVRAYEVHQDIDEDE